PSATSATGALEWSGRTGFLISARRTIPAPTIATTRKISRRDHGTDRSEALMAEMIRWVRSADLPGGANAEVRTADPTPLRGRSGPFDHDAKPDLLRRLVILKLLEEVALEDADGGPPGPGGAELVGPGRERTAPHDVLGRSVAGRRRSPGIAD